MKDASKTYVADMTANPGPLGLVGFGLTTLLLNLHNAGLFPMDTMIMAMGIFIGGIMQVMVGKMEWHKGNIFGTVAFSSYGFFWISLVALMLLPQMGLGTAPSATAMGYYLTVWGLFTVGLFACTFKMKFHMQLLFGTVVLLFGLLAIADFTGNHTIKTIAGIDGIICGSTALYIAISEVVNEVYGKEMMPLK